MRRHSKKSSKNRNNVLDLHFDICRDLHRRNQRPYSAAQNNIKQQIEGSFWALFGLINIAVIKLWAHTKLSMYFIIWGIQNRIENEIRKSESQDL